MSITLHHFPGGCSFVTLNALEQIGLPYELQIVNIMKGEQRSPEYLAVNPWGKVPTLKIGDHLLHENAAILWHLHQNYPEAGLLPSYPLAFGQNRELEDLLWCASTLHPMTRQVRMPVRFTTSEPEGVKAHGVAAWQPVLEFLDLRFSQENWWYQDRRSIIDTYLFWNYSTAQSAGLDLSGFSAVLRHAGQVCSESSYLRAMEREREEVGKKTL